MAFGTGATRNQILDALLAKFSDVANWKTSSRKFQFWDSVEQDAMPAIFLVADEEDHVPAPSGESTPALVTINVTLFIYLWSQDSDLVPSQQMSDVLDKLDTALIPSPLFGNKQTLGGLVSHCWREGRSKLIPGDLEKNGLAIIPLKILVPA